MSYRTDDERKLLLGFLAWKYKVPIDCMFMQPEIDCVNAFLRQRAARPALTCQFCGLALDDQLCQCKPRLGR